ncbi:MAG TPA: TIGR00730 family Rossman fold protein [Gammaproteobacteria bacterium]|nr:TIGR00730 family Rossman fold protein [Gammaproteobacteria bacterium]
MKSVCVYVGANFGKKPAYIQAAKSLGCELAKRDLHLIYGGSCLGLMGILADSVLENGGTVTGIIPEILYKQEAHKALSKLHITSSVQERKKMMYETADCFVALPGGLGTLEELCELWNAAKIGIHQKPFALLNIENYFDKFLEFIDHSVNESFINPECRALIKVSDDIPELLDILMA